MSLTVFLGYAVVAAACAYLFKVVYYYYLANLLFKDDIKTVVSIPIIDAPKDILHKLHVGAVKDLPERGPVYRIINPLKPWDRSIMVADPLLLKEFFAGKDWTKFSRGGSPLAEPHRPYSEGIISMPNDQRWRDTRAMFERTFTTVNVRKYTPILIDLRNVLMDQLEKYNKANPEGFDLFDRFHNFTFDVITRLTFGSEVHAQTTEHGKELSHKFDRWLATAAIQSLVIALFGQWALFLVGKLRREWTEIGKTMFGLLQQEKERIERGDARASIMDDAYAIAMSEKMPASMSDESLRSTLMSILFAGHDTTAALLSFMSYELSKRPDLQAEIRKEVQAAVGDGPIDNLEALENCKVLNACIKESLRMRPSAPFGAGRYMDQDLDYTYTDVTGKQRTIFFRKGDRIVPHLYATQNYAPYWGIDPTVFAPERFYSAPNGDTKVGLWAYNPFGNGSRRCLGERLALAEARLSIASILRKWEMVHVPETTWKFDELMQGTIRPTKVMVQLKEIGKK